ncbi:MAG: hypothetical protein ACI8XZ_004823 [Gammaproteobacteria bacterium]
MSEVGAERRRNFRPLPISPALRLKVDVLVKPIVSGLVQPYRGLVLLGLLIVCCTGWVYWCVESRMAPVHLHFNAVAQEARLMRELDRLEKAFDAGEEAALEKGIEISLGRVIAGYPALANWLHEQAELARLAGLTFSYQMSDQPVASEIDGIVRIPLAVEVKINVQSAANDGYARLLQHLFDIDRDPHLKELTMAEMEAENGQVRILRMDYDVWMFEATATMPSLAPIEREDAATIEGLEVVSS